MLETDARLNLFQTSTPKIPSGTLLQGRFHIRELIGEGATSTVYKAWHGCLQTAVAVKVIHPGLLSNQTSVRRFFREAKILSSLNHSNLVRLLSYGRDDIGFYMVLDFVEGISLKKLIHDRFERLPATAGGGEQIGFTPEDVVRFGLSLCEVMAYVHRSGIVHRDLKPANIIITSENSLAQLKLFDFGIALISEEQSNQAMTGTCCLPGTPAYMSPEQCKAEKLDTRSDIYSMGCLLYELLCGVPPFVHDNALLLMSRHINDNIVQVPSRKPVPRSLERVILKCLEKNPDNRFQSMDELQAELHAIDFQSTLSQFLPVKWIGPASSPVKGLATVVVVLGILASLSLLKERTPQTWQPKEREPGIERKLRDSKEMQSWSLRRRIAYCEKWNEKYGHIDLEGSAKR